MKLFFYLRLCFFFMILVGFGCVADESYAPKFNKVFYEFEVSEIGVSSFLIEMGHSGEIITINAVLGEKRFDIPRDKFKEIKKVNLSELRIFINTIYIGERGDNGVYGKDKFSLKETGFIACVPFGEYVESTRFGERVWLRNVLEMKFDSSIYEINIVNIEKKPEVHVQSV